MCSLVVSVLDSSAVDPRSNPGSGSALLMSEKSQAIYYISSCHMLIDKALSSDRLISHWRALCLLAHETGDVVYSLRFSLIKILSEPGFDLNGSNCS